MKPGKNKKKGIWISVIAILLAIPLVVLPLITVVVYEIVFGQRYETAQWMAFSVADYQGLQVENCEIPTGNNKTLAGYQYKKADQNIKGVVVMAHGLGGGGHNMYMPFIDYFTSHGYYVFAYDATGNGNTAGDSVEGLPQGVKDLDAAICYAESAAIYEGLPVVLFGHSWGAYSAGNVLNLHPEIKAVVMVAGFNESEDLIFHQGKNIVGDLATILVPYVSLYEQIKFGAEYTNISAIAGLKNTDAGVLIVHSQDDTTVPVVYGYDKFYEAFGESDSERFDFVLYEDRGHSYLFYSEAANAYREQLNADYRTYVETNGGAYNEETKIAFMQEHLDKKQCFEPDSELMQQIMALYDGCCY